MPKALLTTICLSAALLLSAPAWAQGAQPQVSVVTLQVVPNPDGSQSVITPKGDLAPLPGSGVYGNTAQIYMGAKGGFWYTDRNGQSVDLDSAVRQLQARRAGGQQAVQVPQYAPQPYYQAPPQQVPQQQQAAAQPTEITNNYNSSGGSSTSSGGMGALGTAAAAGMGAMAGAAMSNSYYNAPYGTPMYYGANGRAYGYHNGEQFEDLNQNQKMALYNKNQINQQNQQQAVQQRQATQQAKVEQTGTNQQSRQESMTQNQSNRQTAYGGQHENYQKQQQWYQDQQRQNPSRFQQSENNPFVAQGANARGGANNFAQNREGGAEGRGGGMREGGAESRGGGGFRGGEGGGFRGAAGGGGGLRGGGGGGMRGGGGGGRRR
ncbi:hypothetical protein KBI23_01015 [bacterium]|nr:hypothetical protein [bacterium]MBP9808913.1 hypothetical protein [bacterium]